MEMEEIWTNKKTAHEPNGPIGTLIGEIPVFPGEKSNEDGKLCVDMILEILESQLPGPQKYSAGFRIEAFNSPGCVGPLGCVQVYKTTIVVGRYDTITFKVQTIQKIEHTIMRDDAEKDDAHIIRLFQIQLD